MNYLKALLAVMSLTFLFTACDDSSTAGSSLIEDQVEIIVDSAYTVTGHSVDNPSVQSRTTLQLLGRFNAEGFGSMSSDIVTQFISSEKIDTAGVKVEDIDSVKLVMRMLRNAYIGDSVTPMGVDVFPLLKGKPLPSPIYSNFDPKEYYNPAEKLGSKIYSTSYIDINNSDELDQYYYYINVDLPVQFGRDFYTEYKTSPSTFATPQAFAKWFPGLYITTSFGNGRMVRIDNNSIKLFYHQHTTNSAGRDTTYNKVGTYMAVAPEVITNNNITLDISRDVQEMARDGKSVLLAPAGMDVEFRFPAREIVAKFNASSGPLSVINTLTFRVPVERIKNDYSIAPPPYLLMIKKSRKEKFFADASLTDTENAFYATYDSSTNSYMFSGLRDYIMGLIKKGENNITDEDVDFVFTPVTVNTETSSGYYQTSEVVTSIVPYISTPVMCILDMENAKIKFTYSKQNIKN